MLSPSEAQAWQEAADGVARRATAGLQRARGAGQAVAFIGQLHRAVDAVAERAAARGVAAQCAAGCAHCCRARVEASEAEVLLLARHLRTWPAAELAALRQRLQRHAAGLQAAAVQDCALLVAGRCSAYALRPAVCRKAHSLSAAACAEGAAQIPQDLGWLLEAEALIGGTAAAYRDAGLAATAQELNAALLAALDDEGAEARWAGE